MLSATAHRQFSSSTSSSSSQVKRESTFVKIWVKRSAAAWPIIGIAGAVVVFCGSFVVHTLRSPEIHTNRAERKTIDFLENDRQASDADKWKQSKFHQGPAFAHPEKRAFDHEK